MSNLGKEICGGVVILVAWFVGFAMGGFAAQKSEQDKAVDAKVAQWFCDPKTGVREFRFLGKENGK